MIKLKKLLYESLLKEALPLSVAKEYASIEQNPSIKKKLDEIFNKLKNLPDAKSSKRGERIYIPYESGDVKSSTKDEIEDVISKKGYKVKDYVKGIATDKYGRDTSIGKVLNKLKQPNLLNAFSSDTVRASSNKSDTYIVFSRHSYDIAGMSTDRDWTSCMNIYDGGYSDKIQYDVSEGSFIAYYVNADDLNINKPIGRIAIKPFVNIKDKDDVVYSTAASNPYGNPPTGFKGMVTEILDKIQNEQSGVFELKSQLYCDISSTIVKFPKIIKNKSDVIKTLILLNIKNYTINGDLSVDVNGDVKILYNTSLTKIPIQFGKVTGDFLCSRNRNLTSLEGSPSKVGGDFECSKNLLTSLEGAPREVDGGFWCNGNTLKSLKGAPEKVGGDFACNDNLLTSLEGAPREVGNFSCSENLLTSLEGGPREVDGFWCNDNKLTSLKGAPEKVGSFNCSENLLTSLEGAPREVDGGFNCFDNKLTSLEGAPKEVGFDFLCHNNVRKFTEQDVRAVCNVKGAIVV